MMKQVVRILIVLSLSYSPPVAASQGRISGDLKKWHKVTIDFTGPETGETATPNPFTDYRLDVVFRNGDRRISVPGYYAADGNAADSGAAAGSVWRVHLAPDRTGRWTYTAQFTTGKNVISTGKGKSAGFFDGAGGSFEIKPTDKTGRDMRSKGLLQYVGKHHLRFAETGEYFLKCGADAPENFLAYADFDGDFKKDGQKDTLIKTWEPHIKDWKPGDPTWKNGRGKGIIGAVNYLASQGMNVFSFLTMNIKGDDRNVFPYIDYDERLRLDVSRLDQWEIVFCHGDRLGMYLHFKTMETENELLLDKGDLGIERKLYYRELIARFSHHLALNWNLGEEINNASTAQKSSWADYFWKTDPYRHHIVIHNGANHYDLMGGNSKLTGFSLQTNRPDFSRVHSATKNYIDRSVAAGKPWVVACDEPGDASHALITDAEDPSRNNARKNGLWGNIMAGGAGVEWYFGYKHPHSDLTCQDYRTRHNAWTQCRYALEFFRKHRIPFWNMKNDNRKASNKNAYCLYDADRVYLVYLKEGGTSDLDLSDARGPFEIRWFNPRKGGALQGGSIHSVHGGGTRSIGRPPREDKQDWAALIRPADPNRNYPPSVNAGKNQAVMLPRNSRTVSVELNGEITDDKTPRNRIGQTWSKVSGPGNVIFEQADSAATKVSLTGAGIYVLKLTGTDGDLTGNDTVTVSVEPFSIRVTKSFTPVSDAYLEGGSTRNNQQLKVEGNRRISFLKFKVEGLPPKILNAALKLTENGDSGSGTIRAFCGSHSNWTEKTLSRSNAPAQGKEAGVYKGGVNSGETVSIPVTPLVTGNGTYTVILTMDKGGNDIWFGSAESGFKPQLTVTAEDPEAR